MYTIAGCTHTVVTEANAVTTALRRAVAQGCGTLRFGIPNIVHRAFCHQGEPFGLDPWQLSPYGLLGDADEYWVGSAQKAKNEPGSPEYEGLSFLVGIDDRGGEVLIPFDVALEVLGDELVGEGRVSNWPYGKIFSNRDDIPNHYHLGEDAAARAGDHSKWESYIIMERFNQRNLRRATYMPAGLHQGTTPDDVLPFLLAENWGDSRWDARKLSPGYLIEPGMSLHMPPGVPHAPVGGRAHFELMERADNFRMISGHQDGIVTPRSTVFRHLPQELLGASEIEKLRHVAESIDYRVSCDPGFFMRNRLTPIRDTENNGNGVPDGVSLEWRIYGRLGGRERYSAKTCTMAPGAKFTLSGPPCFIWVLDGHVRFGSAQLIAETKFRVGQRINCEALKRDGDTVEVENAGPSEVEFLCVFGPDSHGTGMPAYCGENN